MSANDFWDEYDQAEVLLFIEGYDRRRDDWGEMLAHFSAAIMGSSGNYKRGRQPKAEDLWQDREKRAKSASKQRRVRQSAEGVIDLAERRRAMEDFKSSGAPKLPPRKG